MFSDLDIEDIPHISRIEIMAPEIIGCYENGVFSLIQKDKLTLTNWWLYDDVCALR